MTEDSTFESTMEKLKSRGYRKIWIRPVGYEEERVENLSKCHEIIKESKIRLRGWDFPHISNRNPPYNKDECIESFTDWDAHKEVWRYYQNGQFIHMTGFIEDWFDNEVGLFGKHKWSDTPPGSIFGYVNWLFAITEIYEFTTRLAQTNYLGSKFKITIELNGLKDRKLVSLDRDFWITNEFLCKSENLSFETEYLVEDILVNSSKYSLERAIWLFERFNFNNPPREVLEKTQQDYLRNKAT